MSAPSAPASSTANGNVTTTSPAATAAQQRGPQRIIVLCDGTWQQRRSVESAVTAGGVQTGTSENYFTNVALLSQCILPSATPSASSGYVMPQIVYYQDGIGASPYLFSRVLEGATGSTLDLKVQEAYSFLVDNFLPGDELFFFGFSRGAYTARSLAAFVNYLGIMTRAQRSASLSKLWRAFRARSPDKPDTVRAAEQAVFDDLGKWPSSNAMYSAEQNMQGAKILDGAPAATATVATSLPRGPSIDPPTIQVVGVWDTVGALGVPGSFMNPQLVQFYSFFDPMLAPNVRHAFHAMGLGEDRKDFKPTIWLLPTKELPADAKRREGQELRQCWFQGAHSDVGGSHAWHGLSDITLAWMIAQLCDRDGEPPLLNIDLETARRLQDFRVSWAKQPQHPSRLALTLQATRQVCGWQASEGQTQRDAPQTHESIHHSVVVSQQYDPKTSPLFAVLRRAAERGDTRLKSMWEAASDGQTALRPTEKRMRWSEEESAAATRGGALAQPLASKSTLAADDDDNNKQEAIPTIDPDLPPERPENIPEPVWRVLQAICYAPLLVVSYVVNWKQTVLHHTVVPQKNLKPPVALMLVQRLLSKKTQRPAQPEAVTTAVNATGAQGRE